MWAFVSAFDSLGFLWKKEARGSKSHTLYLQGEIHWGRNRQSCSLTTCMNAVLLSFWNVTPVMYHFPANADHNPFLKKKKAFKKKKQTNIFWSARSAECTESPELSKHQAAESDRARCSKQPGTGLLFSSHSESFMATTEWHIRCRFVNVYERVHSRGLWEWECLQQTGQKTPIWDSQKTSQVNGKSPSRREVPKYVSNSTVN